jgi:uncharacterized damage-inducible protein DinB
MSKKTLIARNQRYTQKVMGYLNELAAEGEERLLKAAPDGGWSPFQHLWHLVLAEELSLSYTKKKQSEGKHVGPVNFKARWRNLLLQIAMRTPVKIKAPAAVGGNPEVFPAQPSWTLLTQRYQQVREAWAQFLGELSEPETQLMFYKHPRAGHLSFAQALAFFNVHFDRHCKSIRRLI